MGRCHRPRLVLPSGRSHRRRTAGACGDQRTASASLTVSQEALNKALALKAKGNTLFTAKPPNITAALNAYQRAVDVLAVCEPKLKAEKPTVSPPPPESGLQEVTEEEADAIEEARKVKEAVKEKEPSEREKLEDDIRECYKACWGNRAACHIARVSSHVLSMISAQIAG